MDMPAIDETHDPGARSWVAGADNHADFPVQNLPLGVASWHEGAPRVVSRIGDYGVDLRALVVADLLPAIPVASLEGGDLNALFALPVADRRALRRALFAVLTDPVLRSRAEPALHPIEACRMHLPFRVGDYTDFYAGIHHALNIGRLFRPDQPLLPNYKHIPIGYHGRASSVRLSGTPVVRPQGQRKAPNEELPDFGPRRRLDHELELGVWVAGGNRLGEPVPLAEAWSHIGGLCLLNDWSARDLQAWEYQPLGPFLAKNFLTSVSPWVITAEALAPFRMPQPVRPAGDPAPLPYLDDAADRQTGALAIHLETWLMTARMRATGEAPYRLSAGPASNLYWTLGQLLTHHTSNGCNLAPGDLLGTGTISGPEPGSFGSLMEITCGGREPVILPNGEQRTFLEDGDELILTARAERDGWRALGFGHCAGTVCAAR